MTQNRITFVTITNNKLFMCSLYFTNEDIVKLSYLKFKSLNLYRN